MNTKNKKIVNKGRAFVYGDDINTDVLAPGAYLKFSTEEMAKHCLEAIDPNFVSNVEQGDIVVGGNNFGVGSSREQAAASLVILGINFVIAKNFARIFYRNAFNLGLIPLICDEYYKITNQDLLEIKPKEGKIINLTKNTIYNSEPIPNHLLKIVQSGGLIEDLKNRIKNGSINNIRYRNDH